MGDFLWRHRVKVVATAGVAAVILTVLYFVVPSVAGAVAVAAGWFGVGIVFFVSNREQVEKTFGRSLAVISWAGATVQRQALASEIQGVINGGRRDLPPELGDLMPYPAAVKFVRDEADLAQLENGQVVIALRHPRKHAENMARATLAYIGEGMVRQARPYVDHQTMQSIDYSVAKRLLLASDTRALDYLLTQMWSPATQRDPVLRALGHQAELVEEEGLLTRVILVEFLELGRRLFGRFPSDEVQAATRKFLAFVHGIATRSRYESVELDFHDDEIRVGFVLVGDREVRERLGADPYVGRALTCLRRGFDSVYLLAGGAARPVLEDVVKRLQGHGQVLDIELSEYVVARRGGPKVEAVCAHVIFDHSGPSVGRSRGRPNLNN